MRTRLSGHTPNASPFTAPPVRGKRTVNMVKARFGAVAAARQIRRTGQLLR